MFETITEDLLNFLDKSPTAFHAVGNIRTILVSRGYEELIEGNEWKLSAGGRYFVVRNESSIAAFRLPGAKQTPAEADAAGPAAGIDFRGFMIAAAHTDSPLFKLKTEPEIKSMGTYVMLNVEKYGGMLLNPWFDRPLSVAGRVIVREALDEAQPAKGARFVTKLINVDRDLAMIPSLAIHMDRNANEGHKISVQKEMLPIFGDGTASGKFADLIAETAGVDKEDIVGSDLFLYSRVPSSRWGAEREFVSAGRLDDLQCVYASLRGFLEAEEAGRNCPEGAFAEHIRSIPLFVALDNEEVGSRTKQGADSTFLGDVIERIGLAAGKNGDEMRRTIASSFMVSADNAHAVHPNYQEKADPVNRPFMNRGIVIKHSANQKYTTDAVSAAVFKEVCRQAQVPWQEFTNHADVPGGSTMGNIASAQVSLNTVDIGLAQLAMHSPYETAGEKDTAYLARAMKTFFEMSFVQDGAGVFRLNDSFN